MSKLSALSIYLSKRRKVLPFKKSPCRSRAEAATFDRNIHALGFALSPELFKQLSGHHPEAIAKIYADITPVLKEMTGDHRQFKPMYPNFPKQVMEASELELYLNAMTHYWAAFVGDVLGIPCRWLPDYKKEKREDLLEEEVQLKVIDLGDSEDFDAIFTQLISSNGSLSESDKEIVKWFCDNYAGNAGKIKALLPDTIPSKENLAYLYGCLAVNAAEGLLAPHLKTATDALRVAVALSSGDVSLAANTKFRRFKRSERRFFLEAIDKASNATEDMLRRPEVWKRFGRELRPGDYAKAYPKAHAAFNVVREDKDYSTFNGRVEDGLIKGNFNSVVESLRYRPGDFARRLDHLIRSKGTTVGIVRDFAEVAGKVSTPVLLQVHAHFKGRDSINGHRAFFPKGSVAKVQVVEEALPKLPRGAAKMVADAARDALVERFSELPKLGKVYVDEALSTQFVPFAKRSASKSLRTISRGSRIPLPDCKCLRFFVWWKDGDSRTDLDLSAVFYGKDWNRLADVMYYNLRNFGCAHSGDITSAPKGACEFIDCNIDALLEKGVAFVQMVVTSFTQQAFKDLPECFAGWMARSAVQSGEVFEGRAVVDKVDIAGDTTTNVPVLFDLVNRQAIWSDIALKNRNAIHNVRRSGDNLAKMGRAIAELRKPTLGDLFAMHAEARGKLVKTKDKADQVFSMTDGITPFDQDRIMSEFMAN